MRAGGDGAAERLAVDVAGAAQREASPLQLARQCADRGAGLHAYQARFAVAVEHAVEPRQRHEAAAGERDVVERMAAPDRADRLTGGVGVAQHASEIVRRPRACAHRGNRALVARPVRPAVASAHEFRVPAVQGERPAARGEGVAVRAAGRRMRHRRRANAPDQSLAAVPLRQLLYPAAIETAQPRKPANRGSQVDLRVSGLTVRVIRRRPVPGTPGTATGGRGIARPSASIALLMLANPPYAPRRSMSGRLARRLVAAIDWLDLQRELRGVPVGCFGEGTAAAAALIAAGARERVSALSAGRLSRRLS